jgi:alkanesulfonate monooxygenase SsuD/methylene tetrahydromethanopterin reductase-like flavin-dependent oxidoreductase (luciferase family)
MRIGVVILPDLRWPQAEARWQEAEQRGFATAWTYDHLSWRALRDGPWLGTVPLLAAIAASTTTLRLGTLVTTPNFRHPALLAKDIMTLDEISAGRIDVGVGAGGTGYDATVLGGPPLKPPERAARFEDFVAALDLLLREPASSYAGDYYTVVDSRTLPGCTQSPRPPFAIAATGRRALAVAARFGDMWVTNGPVQAEPPGQQAWLAGVVQQVQHFDAAYADAGRTAPIRRAAVVSLGLTWAQTSVQAWDDLCGALQDLGFTDVIVHWPRPEDADLPGPAPEVFEEISRRNG